MTTPPDPRAPTLDQVMQYWTHPIHGTVHLAPSGDPTVLPRTLCGQPLTGAWLPGDETVSGHVADCRNCRRFRTAARWTSALDAAIDPAPGHGAGS